MIRLLTICKVANTKKIITIEYETSLERRTFEKYYYPIQEDSLMEIKMYKILLLRMKMKKEVEAVLTSKIYNVLGCPIQFNTLSMLSD